MTLDELQKTEWYQSRPEVIKLAINKMPPIQLYKFKTTGKQCRIISFEEPDSGKLEDVTMMVQKTGVGGPLAAMGLAAIDTNKVFGVGLDDLKTWND